MCVPCVNLIRRYLIYLGQTTSQATFSWGIYKKKCKTYQNALSSEDPEHRQHQERIDANAKASANQRSDQAQHRVASLDSADPRFITRKTLSGKRSP
jgi:hypothetical protein